MGVPADKIRNLVSREDLAESMSVVDTQLARQATDQLEREVELRNSQQELQNGHANLQRELRQLEGSTQQAIDRFHGTLRAEASASKEEIVSEFKEADERLAESCSNLEGSLDSFKEDTADFQEKVDRRFNGTHKKIGELKEFALDKFQTAKSEADNSLQAYKSAANDEAKCFKRRMDKHEAGFEIGFRNAKDERASIKRSHDDLKSQVTQHKSSCEMQVAKACKDLKSAKDLVGNVDKRFVALEEADKARIATLNHLHPTLASAIARIAELEGAAKDANEGRDKLQSELNLTKQDADTALYHVDRLSRELTETRKAADADREAALKRHQELEETVKQLTEAVFNNSPGIVTRPVSPVPDAPPEASRDNALTCQPSTQANEQTTVEVRAPSSFRPVETGSVATDHQAQPSSFPAGEETSQGYNEQAGEQHSPLQQGEGEGSAAQPAHCSSSAVDAAETEAHHDEDRSGDSPDCPSQSRSQCSAQASAPFTPQIAFNASASDFVPAPPPIIPSAFDNSRSPQVADGADHAVSDPEENEPSSGEEDAAAAPQEMNKKKKRRRRPERRPHKKAQKERIELQFNKVEWDQATEEAREEARARHSLGYNRHDWGRISDPDVRDRILRERVPQEASEDWRGTHNVFFGHGYLPSGPNFLPPPVSSPYLPSSGSHVPRTSPALHGGYGPYSPSPFATSSAPLSAPSQRAQTSAAQYDDLRASIYAPPARLSYSPPPRRSDILPAAPPNAPTGPRSMAQSHRPSANLYRPPQPRSEGHAPPAGPANLPFSTGSGSSAFERSSPFSPTAAAYTPTQPVDARLQTSYHRRPQHGESEEGRLR